MNLLKGFTVLALPGLLICSLAHAQDTRSQTRVQATTPPLNQPSSAELVNKMLNPGPSDPNVPLAQYGVSRGAADDPAVQSPAFYGRKEENGALLGVRVPFPNETRSATR